MPEYPSASLVLNRVKPPSGGGDPLVRYHRRVQSAKRSGIWALKTEELLSEMLAYALLGSQRKPLIEEVVAFIEEHGLLDKATRELAHLAKEAQPESDGPVVVLGLLTAFHIVRRRLPKVQKIDMFNHLLDYWRKGLPVIPQIDKRPMVKGWTEFAYQIPSQWDVRKWQGWEFDAIGLVLGPASDLCVIDIDVRENHDGREAWEVDPDHPHLVSTTSGGYHLYYLHRGIHGKRWLGEGVEFFGTERKVTLPPSRGSYHWVNETWDKIPNFDLRFRELEDDPYAKPKFQSDVPVDDAWAMKVADMRDPATAGSRVDAAVRYIGYMIRKGIDNVDTMQAAIHRWNVRNDPPLTDTELRHSVFTCIPRFMQAHQRAS